MPRPDLKGQRRNQIFDAFERCVARYGVEGASLDRVAAEAGLARALIRHNVGNREELVRDATARFVQREAADWSETLDALPKKDRYETLVTWLFDPQHADPHTVRVFEGLLSASADDQEIARLLRDWHTGFLRMFETDLTAHAPHADQKIVRAVAAGVMGIYFNIDTSSVLGQDVELRHASADAARILFARLGHR